MYMIPFSLSMEPGAPIRHGFWNLPKGIWTIKKYTLWLPQAPEKPPLGLSSSGAADFPV